MNRDEAARSLKYFWLERGDITRMTDWKLALLEFPEAYHAYLGYKSAERAFTEVIKTLPSEGASHD